MNWKWPWKRTAPPAPALATDDVPIAERRIDMSIPDSFHRLKRTVLLFATALILLALAETQPNATLAIPFTSGAGLPLSVAQPLLMVATVYYLIGFLLEFLAVRRVNTGIFEGGAASLQDALGELTRRVRWPVQREAGEPVVDDANSKLLLDISRFEASIEALRGLERDLPERVRTAIVSLYSRSMPPPSDPTHFADAVMRQALGKDGMHPIDVADPELPLVQAITNHQRVLTEVQEQVNVAHDAVAKLSSRIAGARKLSFNWWELGSTVMYVVVALLWSLIDLGVEAGLVV